MAAALKKTPKPHLSSLSKLLPNQAQAQTQTPSSLSDPSSIARTKSLIRSEPDPDRLFSLFSSSFSHPHIHGDRSLYKRSILKLSRSNRRDLIESLLESQKSDPSLPRSEGFLIRIITLYSDAGMLDHAVKTFDFIPSTGLKHSERTLCALLTVYLKNRRFDQLLHAFNSVPESVKLKPGITAHNIVLQGLCENGDVDGARKLLNEMPEKGVIPDVVSYNAVFNGYLKKGDKEGCDWVLKEMNEKGLEGNVATFNCRVAALCARGRSFEAEELLEVMARKNVRPNRGTYNLIIEGFCKEGNSKKAMRVFERMKSGKKKGVEDAASPDFSTYIVLIRSLVENGEFGKGLEMFKECVDRKWSPPFGAVRAMVEGLKKEGRVEEAKDVVAKMSKVVKGDAMDTWKAIEAAITF